MKTLKNIGKLQVIDKIQDGAGKRIAGDFLQQLLEEFSRCSFRQIDFYELLIDLTGLEKTQATQ